MATHRKCFRFRMRPTPTQAAGLNRLAGARRWVWNWALARCKSYFAATGKTIPRGILSAELTALKKEPETAWLKEAHAQSLQQTLADLHRAYANFFAKRAKFPRFKSRKRDRARFRMPQDVKVADGSVYVPKIGFIRIRQSQPVDSVTKSATFRRSATGKWFVTLVTEFEMPEVALPFPNPASVAGIDLGLINFATITDADSVPAPKFFRKGQRKLRRAQRQFSRRKPGSVRKAKAKLKVARVHERTANQRKDFLHKLTTDLVRTHEGLCIEDLCLRGLVRTKLAKSFTDASLGEFRRQLEYKSEWNRKHLVVVDRFFPSSKLCHGCGKVNHALTLSDRHWVCDCGMVHERDPSAAINLKDEGLRILAAGLGRESKRSGRHCKTPPGGACH